MRKILNIILAVLLVAVTAFSLVACAPNDGGVSSRKGLRYRKIDGVYTIFDYVDEGNGVTELDIGAILAETEISDDFRIKKGAFDGNDTLTKIVVPEQVIEVEEGAFRNMKKLQTLEVCFIGRTVNADAFELESATAVDKSVDSARTIAHYFGTEEYDAGRAVTVVYGAASKTCYMPITFENVIVNAVKTAAGRTSYSIPMHAFNGANNIKSVVLKGDKLGAIGENAFNGCVALASIEIPETVKTIYKNAFNGCTKLASVAFGSNASEVVVKEKAFEGCTAISYLGVKVDTLPAVKTVDLSVFAQIGNKALDFGNEHVTYKVANAGEIDLGLAFGETGYAE